MWAPALLRSRPGHGRRRQLRRSPLIPHACLSGRASPHCRELYKHFYAFSRYLWQRNITRIELYNEPGEAAAPPPCPARSRRRRLAPCCRRLRSLVAPACCSPAPSSTCRLSDRSAQTPTALLADLDNDYQNADGTFKSAAWVDTMKLRSRAIQDAYAGACVAGAAPVGGVAATCQELLPCEHAPRALPHAPPLLPATPPPLLTCADLNAENPAQPARIPNVHVGAFAKTTYGGGNLGQPSLQAQHGTFARGPSADPAWRNLQTYSYHSYSQSGATILSNFRELQAASAADRAAQGDLPFSVTEFNAHTSNEFTSMTSTMETPSKAAKLGELGGELGWRRGWSRHGRRRT